MRNERLWIFVVFRYNVLTVYLSEMLLIKSVSIGMMDKAFNNNSNKMWDRLNMNIQGFRITYKLMLTNFNNVLLMLVVKPSILILMPSHPIPSPPFHLTQRFICRKIKFPISWQICFEFQLISLQISNFVRHRANCSVIRTASGKCNYMASKNEIK